MNHSFIKAYQDIKNSKLTHLTGLWLIHGDDTLLHQWFIDACRPLFKQHGQIVKRISLNTPQDWASVTTEVASLSLFGDKVAVILDGKVRPDSQTIDKLGHFAQDPNGNTIIYTLPHQDKKAQNTKLFTLFSQYGQAIDAKLYDERLRSELLSLKAYELNTNFGDDAWRFLLSHTENNLLSAYQALIRLTDLYFDDPKVLDVSDVIPAIVSDYQYSVFHLGDSLLLGDTPKVLQILQHLRQTDTAPSVVLWGLAKEIQLVLKAMNNQNFDSLGIWRSKTHLYQKALKNGYINSQFLEDLYNIDKSIKGLTNDNAWQQIEHLCLKMCGVMALT